MSIPFGAFISALSSLLRRRQDERRPVQQRRRRMVGGDEYSLAGLDSIRWVDEEPTSEGER